jgi:hypothetical protein
MRLKPIPELLISTTILISRHSGFNSERRKIREEVVQHPIRSCLCCFDELGSKHQQCGPVQRVGIERVSEHQHNLDNNEKASSSSPSQEERKHQHRPDQSQLDQQQSEISSIIPLKTGLCPVLFFNPIL